MDTYTEKVKYWDNVYGFKMSCMRTPLLEEASVSYASSEHVMSEPAMIKVSIILGSKYQISSGSVITNICLVVVSCMLLCDVIYR